ncbi:hypothetical protein I4U23_002175 [Adineta vaga]|nr:hypothetical protein I4U23_002175 [Adineta vaga]
MNSNHIARDKIITEWFLQEWIGDTSHLPSPEDVVIFMQIVIDVVSMNRTVNDSERNYLIGRAAILGVPEEMLNELQTYQPVSFKDIANLDVPHIRKTRMGIIYNLFRIFGGECKISPKELKLIHTFGKQLNVSDDQIQQIQNLYEDEEKLRQKRALLLFPNGFNDVLIEYQKLH